MEKPTYKQILAVIKISENKGEKLSWDEVESWDKKKVSDYINKNGDGGYYRWEKEKRRVERLPLNEQKEYYLKNKSWINYFVTCWKLGEITKEELQVRKSQFLKGVINEIHTN